MKTDPRGSWLPLGPRAGLASLLVVCAALAACDGRAASPSSDGAAPPVPAPLDSAAGEVVAVDDQRLANELEAAMGEARRTAAAARRRWSTDPQGRDLWSVKWAAPVLGGEGAGRVEHVWVRPLRWTANRIEGVLLSEPKREIGAARGALVGFRAEELSDWLEQRRDGRGHVVRADGGFTLAAIERRRAP